MAAVQSEDFLFLSFSRVISDCSGSLIRSVILSSQEYRMDKCRTVKIDAAKKELPFLRQFSIRFI